MSDTTRQNDYESAASPARQVTPLGGSYTTTEAGPRPVFGSYTDTDFPAKSLAPASGGDS